VAEARSFVLLERFELQRWAEAVRTCRPRAVSLVPAALRAVLHSDLNREDLAGIRAVPSGTAPLSADDADAFTEGIEGEPGPVAEVPDALAEQQTVDRGTARRRGGEEGFRSHLLTIRQELVFFTIKFAVWTPDVHPR